MGKHIRQRNVRKEGRMAEWLGTGLQNLLQRFESASDLNSRKVPRIAGYFCYSPNQTRLRGMEGAVTKTASKEAAFLGLKRPPPGSASAHPPRPNPLARYGRGCNKNSLERGCLGFS
jgi:hypothetical protein